MTRLIPAAHQKDETMDSSDTAGMNPLDSVTAWLPGTTQHLEYWNSARFTGQSSPGNQENDTDPVRGIHRWGTSTAVHDLASPFGSEVSVRLSQLVCI